MKNPAELPLNAGLSKTNSWSLGDMARARNIKPGFFKNELLAEISPAGRLFFEGLWCVADREGRIEDRPRRLWAEVMPYDPYEGDEVMKQLAERGFIERYEVDGVHYAQIVNFLKHQAPHCKEKASVIPPNPARGTGKAPDKHGASPVQAPDKHGASPVQAPDKHRECTEQAPPGFPDSLIAREEDSTANAVLVGSGAADAPNPPADPDDGAAAAKPKTPDCPHQEIIDLYHEILPELPRVKVWNADRRKQLKARWREEGKRQSLDYWRTFFRYVRNCPFLMGQCDPAPGRARFEADLPWLVRANNFAKVIEGKYAEKRRDAA